MENCGEIEDRGEGKEGEDENGKETQEMGQKRSESKSKECSVDYTKFTGK